jgi:hypothetical protein
MIWLCTLFAFNDHACLTHDNIDPYENFEKELWAQAKQRDGNYVHPMNY